MTGLAARLLIEPSADLPGPARRDRGLAMRAELAAAIEEGRGLGLAGGGRFAFARTLPMHPEGRFMLAANA